MRQRARPAGPPQPPEVYLTHVNNNNWTLRRKIDNTSKLSSWVIYVNRNGQWDYTIVPAAQDSFEVHFDGPGISPPPGIAVSSVDRFGNESKKVFVANQ